MKTLLDAAHSYIEGSPQWPLFPAHAKTKRPLIKTGIDHAENASTDPAVIERWITRDFPGCALAMPTGLPTQTIVVDVDAKHDGEGQLRLLEDALCPLPRDRVARTQSGGLHLYFRHPGPGVRVRTGQGDRSQLGKLLGRPGLDVRADGGIVVLPPSIGYQWLSDEDTLSELPKLWLLAIQGAGDPPRKPAPQWNRFPGAKKWSEPERGGPINTGERNGELYRRGVALRIAGATDAEILDDLERVNASRCHPSLPQREVERIATSAARAQGRRL